MHRRDFLAALTGVGALLSLAGPGSALSLPEVAVARGYMPRRRNDTFGLMEIRILALPDAKAAERARRLTLQAPAMENFNEIYVSGPRAQHVPEHLARLPGDVLRYDVIAGAAAVRSTQLVSAFRIDSLMWMIDVSNADVSLVVDLAQGITAQVHAVGIDSLTSARDLRRLLPGTDAFDVPIDTFEASEIPFCYRD